MTMTRRHFGAVLAAGTGAAALAGCTMLQSANTSIQTTLATVASDVTAVAAGFAGVLSDFGTIIGMPAATLAAIEVDVADLQTIAKGVATAANASVAAPLLQTFEDVINAVVSAVAGLNLPAPLNVIFSAASALLPAIEAGITAIISSVSPSTPTAAAAAPMFKGIKYTGIKMSADTARQVFVIAANGNL